MSRALQPCGTTAAAQRHYRNNEPLDEACRAAVRGQFTDRSGGRPSSRTPERREVRNGLPEFRPYTYGGTGADVLTGHLSDQELEMANG